MAAPAIGNLNDDNGDGRVDEDDIPDIVFTNFSGGAAFGYTLLWVIVAVPDLRCRPPPSLYA